MANGGGTTQYSVGKEIPGNKLGITNPDISRLAEYKFASIRELELGVNPIQGDFDLDHLKAIHGHLFQDMYEWAGELRNVDMRKSDQSGLMTRFTSANQIEQKARELRQFMQDHNGLKGLGKPEFVKAITEVHSKLNEMHPFREGNGRATRVFLTQLSREAGFELDLSKIAPERWNEASARAQVQQDRKNPAEFSYPAKMDMRQIFHESLTPTMAHALQHESKENALKHYPSLAKVYDHIEGVKDYAQYLTDKQRGVRIVDAEISRIADKLETATSEQQQSRAMKALREERMNLRADTVKIGKSGDYELVAVVMADVMKSQGYPPQTIAASIEVAHNKLDEMKEKGIPAPGIKVYDKEGATERSLDFSKSRSTDRDIAIGDR